MKIIMVTNTYLPIVGGLEKSIELFTRKFREWGHEILILVPELENAESDEPGIIRIPSFHEFKHSDFSVGFPLIGALSKVVDSFQPDVIHAHHPFLMGEMALRLSARFAKPLIFTYHIMFDQYAHYMPLPSALGRRFLVELAAGFANLSTRVIAPSESVREILLKEGVKRPVDIVPTGVDISVFAKDSVLEKKRARLCFGIPADAFVLGYVGRLAPEKNLEFLARSVIDFMRLFPAHFFAAGKGPSEEMLRKLFCQAGMQDRFHFAGVLHGQSLADGYHALDVFTFASKSETQGMVLCEAMAAGVPVIALDAPGVREVVKDYVNGRLLFKESETEFASAFLEFMKLSYEEKENLKSRARDTAKAFSLDACSLRALKVYETAVANYSAPAMSEQSEWRRLMRRLSTEWKIMASIGRATGLALSEILTS